MQPCIAASLNMRLGAALVVCLLLPACKEAIVHDLNELEANRVVSRLSEQHIISDKRKQTDGKWSIEVREEDFQDALLFLEKTRILRGDSAGNIDSISVVSSKEQQKLQYERAVSSELEATLENIEGVLFARVHLNPVKTDPVFGSRVDDGQATGSVLLLVGRAFSQPPTAIAGLIAGAAGIEPSRISVLVTQEPEESPSALQPGFQPMGHQSGKHWWQAVYESVRSKLETPGDRPVLLAIAMASLIAGIVALRRALSSMRRKRAGTC